MSLALESGSHLAARIGRTQRTRRARRVLGLGYRRFLGFQLLVLLFSLAVSEAGNTLVYATKYFGTALPLMSCGALFVLGQDFSGAVTRSMRSFRFVWLLTLLAFGGSLLAADGRYSAMKVLIFALTFLSMGGLLVQYEFVRRGERADTLLRHLLIACFTFLAVMFLNYYVLNRGGGAARYRAGGNLIAPTQAAAAVGLALFVALLHTVRTRARLAQRGLRWIAFATVALSAWGLLVLGTRAAFVCTAGALFVAPLIAGGWRLTYRRLLFGTLALLGTALLVVNLDALGSLLARDVDTSSVWTMSGRTWLWARAFHDLTLPRIFTGYGFAAISEGIGIRDWWTGETMFAGAHNAYLQVFLGTGVFGLYLYYRFLKQLFRTLARRAEGQVQRTQVLSIAIFIYFATFGITEHLFGLNLTPTFFIICCIFASVHLRACETRRSPATFSSDAPREV
jgi:O-antigen ligase